jgi:antitoxin HicB
MTVRYLIKLEPDDNDTLLVTCPALPEVATFGEDEADAVRRARDAIEEALAARIVARSSRGPASHGGTQGVTLSVAARNRSHSSRADAPAWLESGIS